MSQNVLNFLMFKVTMDSNQVRFLYPASIRYIFSFDFYELNITAN